MKFEIASVTQGVGPEALGTALIFASLIAASLCFCVKRGPFTDLDDGIAEHSQVIRPAMVKEQPHLSLELTGDSRAYGEGP